MNDPSREPGAYVDTGGLLSRSSGHIRPGGASPMPGAASPKYPSLPVACEAEVETRSPALAPPLAVSEVMRSAVVRGVPSSQLT